MKLEDSFEYKQGVKQGLQFTTQIEEDTNFVMTSEFINYSDPILIQAMEKNLPIVNTLWFHLSVYTY